MNHERTVCILVLSAALALVPQPAAAQEDYSFTLILEAGIGGPISESGEDDAGFSDGFQAGFSIVSRPGIHVGGRAGEINFDTTDRLGSLVDPSLEYIHLGGEYRFTEYIYESGIYLGLGYYRLGGTNVVDGLEVDDDSIGLALGVTGEFELTPKLGLMIEGAGHITELEAKDIFVTLHAGLAFHF